MQTALAVPLFTDPASARPTAVIEAVNKLINRSGAGDDEAGFTLGDSVVLGLVGDAAGCMLAGAAWRRQLTTLNRTTALWNHTMNILSIQTNTEQLLRDLCANLVLLTDSTFCIFFSVDHRTAQLNLRYCSGYLDIEHNPFNLALERACGLMGLAMETGNIVMRPSPSLRPTPEASDFSEIAGPLLHGEEPETTLVAPILQQATGAVIGVVQLVNKEGGNEYSALDQRVVTAWAQVAAIAIEHTALIDRQVMGVLASAAVIDRLRRAAQGMLLKTDTK